MLRIVFEEGCSIGFSYGCRKDHIAGATAPQQLGEYGVGLHQEPVPTPKTVKVVSVREADRMIGSDVQIKAGILFQDLLNE